MSDPNTTKMLQSIIDGQSAIKEEIKDDINRLENKVDSLETKVDDGFKKVNKRIDKLGLQLARLEDDAPTAEEFDKLEKRVTTLKHRVTNN